MRAAIVTAFLLTVPGCPARDSTWCPVTSQAECDALAGELCREDNCTAPGRKPFCVTGNDVAPAQEDPADPDGDGYRVVDFVWQSLRVDCGH
jgi:hypothetical protein